MKRFMITKNLVVEIQNLDVNHELRPECTYIHTSVLYPELFGYSSTSTGTGTLTKVLESKPSDRLTNKSYGSI